MSEDQDSKAWQDRQYWERRVLDGLASDVDKVEAEQVRVGKEMSHLRTKSDDHEKRLDHHDGRISALEASRQSSDEHQACLVSRSQPPKGVPWLPIVILGSFLLAAVIIAAIIVGRPVTELLPEIP